jgi:3-oxoacyl-[acyl-carrier-protein] synthase III
MRIEAVKFVHPKTRMTNDDVIDVIRFHSKDVFNGDLERTLGSIKYMMDAIGLKSRYWMRDETPLELMARAAEEAMAEAGVDRKDIDLLVFCGIGRGFLEPGDSYFVAQRLGMDSVDCFDIMDACMAWSRTCDVVEAFFKSGRYKRALIVNGESYYVDGGISYPSNFILKDYRAIEYSFGAFCGGDGATATILSADDDNPWERHYMSTKEGADLCTIPLPGYEKRCMPSKHIGHNGIGAFTAYGSKVFDSYQYMIDILKKITPKLDEMKMIFAHTGGDIHAYEKWAVVSGAGGRIRYLFPDYGNIGSASIPASIATHVAKGELKRGDKFGAWIGSSGMAFTSYIATY